MADEKELNPSPKFPEGKYPELSPNPNFSDGLVNKTDEKPNTQIITQPKVQEKSNLTVDDVIELIKKYGGGDKVKLIYPIVGTYEDLSANDIKAIVDGDYICVKITADESTFAYVSEKYVGGTGVYFLNIYIDKGSNGSLTLVKYQVDTDNQVSYTEVPINGNTATEEQSENE